jgi:hypothetical protein
MCPEECIIKVETDSVFIQVAHTKNVFSNFYYVAFFLPSIPTLPVPVSSSSVCDVLAF